jgi:hypothetical protein
VVIDNFVGDEDPWLEDTVKLAKAVAEEVH